MYFQSGCEHTDAFSMWQNTEMTSNTDPMTSRLLRSFRGEPYGNRAPATLSGIWRLPYKQKCTICFYRSDREQRIVDMSVEASSPVRFAKKLPLISSIRYATDRSHVQHYFRIASWRHSDWSIVLSVSEFASWLDDNYWMGGLARDQHYQLPYLNLSNVHV